MLAAPFGVRLVDDLFRARYEEMVGLAVVVLGGLAGAEDIVQDAFAALIPKADSLESPDRAAGYLARSVVNGCRSKLRRARVANARPVPSPELVASAEAAALRDQAGERVRAAVLALPPKQRIAVACHFYLGLDRAETCEVMGVSLNSLKTHLSRATKTLARNLEGER